MSKYPDLKFIFQTLFTKVRDLEEIVKKTKKDGNPHSSIFNKTKEDIKTELLEINPKILKEDEVVSAIYFNANALISHTSTYYAKDDKRMMKFKSLTEELKKNLLLKLNKKPSEKKKKKIVLKYDAKLLPELIHDNEKYKAFIKSAEFKKLTQTEQKMYIELKNSHKYLGCKAKQELVCGVPPKPKSPAKPTQLVYYWIPKIANDEYKKGLISKKKTGNYSEKYAMTKEEEKKLIQEHLRQMDHYFCW